VLELGDGWCAELVFDRVRIRRAAIEASDAVEWGRTEAGAVRWDDWEFAWRLEPAGVTTREGSTAWMPPGLGVIRAAGRGDRMFPVGGTGHRSVSRLLMEARVPRSERMTYPVVLRQNQLVWLPEICRAGQTVPAEGEPSLRIDARRA
jgi:tRNA(Ile)-lysidine synthetase-like protein